MKISLIGAGGHARCLLPLLKQLKVEAEGIYDDSYQAHRNEIILGVPVKGNIAEVPKGTQVIISKGNCFELKGLSEQFSSQLDQKNLIHASAIVETEKVGKANQILALSYLSATAEVGNSNIIYSHSTIEHEVVLGNYNIVTVNVSLCGRVKIGDSCFFGAGSTILPGVEICDNVTIGAGAVVTKTITEAGTYVGIPAKKISK
ncbi:MAG: DapH/DapD/GlmU-related protein [Vicingaceae bacterium]